MIRFYFDFISPYSYLAAERIDRSYSELPFEPRPISLASLFAKRGVKGPGEIPDRRRRGLEDVVRLAFRDDVPFVGPPRHPFNSLYALRSVCGATDRDSRWALTMRYFRAAWAEGGDLSDPAQLRLWAREAGVVRDPEDAATDPVNRRRLKTNTAEALAAGAWGAPTFVAGDALFFGQDRLELLRAFVQGESPNVDEKVRALLARG